jgi:hypothetical protein
LGQYSWSDKGGSWLDMDSSGNALAVWYQHDDPNYNVYAAQFDGVAWGNSYRLDPDNTGMAFEPRLAIMMVKACFTKPASTFPRTAGDHQRALQWIN